MELILLKILTFLTQIVSRPLPPFLEMGTNTMISPSVGYPVWSSSSNSNNQNIAAVEKQWNEGIIFPPLQGWIGWVNPRSTVFTQRGSDESTRKDLITIKDHVLSLFFIETENNEDENGYILINRLEQPEQRRTSIIVNLEDGSDRTNDLLSNVGLYKEGAKYIAIPSRDGSFIAAVAWDELEMKLSLIDVSTMEAAMEPSVQTLNHIVGDPQMFWDTDSVKSTFILMEKGDTVNEQTRISIDGVMASTLMELSCIPYPTSSGRIRVEDGMFVTVNIEQNEIEISHFDEWNNCTSINEI